MRTPNGWYSARFDGWSTHNSDGLYFYRERDNRRYFMVSRDLVDAPWLAITDDFGNLVPVVPQ